MVGYKGICLMTNKFYITTAIPYVNASPHMGHALEFVQTDVIARYQKLEGRDVFVTTGTDENSLKSVQAAAKEKVPAQLFCDRNSESFKKLAKDIGLHYDAFIRSSDKDAHWKGVERLWKSCFDSGDIYKKTYKGLYCTGCEAFYKESELVNGLCPEHLTPPEVVQEENYFFRLSRYEQKLEELILTNKLKVTPETRKNEVLSYIRQGLEDFSISRPAERSKGWGIPVPNDDSQKVYVWFDALSVYLTGIGFGRDEKLFEKLWPADIHVIGKGIIRFHAIYWPAILMSAGLEVPKEVLVHGYVTSGGRKMSKSLGNVADPLKILGMYGEDGVRYYLLRKIPTFEDGDFSEEDVVTTINNELVGNIGNFVHRTLTFIYKNFGGEVRVDGALEGAETKVLMEVGTLVSEAETSLSKNRLGNGLADILAIAAAGNKYFQESKPWETVTSDRQRCERVLFTGASICRTLSVLLYPYLPVASDKLSSYLNIDIKSFDDAKPLFKGSIKTAEPQPLFQKRP